MIPSDCKQPDFVSLTPNFCDTLALVLQDFRIMSSVWDYCVFDGPTSTLMDSIENFAKSGVKAAFVEIITPSSSGSANPVRTKDQWDAQIGTAKAGDDSGIDGLQESLVSSESSCRSFMGELDSLLLTLGDISSLHNDVTGRTNSLMFNCENLLEQQVGFARDHQDVLI